jgi:hypothetical protein
LVLAELAAALDHVVVAAVVAIAVQFALDLGHRSRQEESVVLPLALDRAAIVGRGSCGAAEASSLGRRGLNGVKLFRVRPDLLRTGCLRTGCSGLGAGLLDAGAALVLGQAFDDNPVAVVVADSAEAESREVAVDVAVRADMRAA